jgi:hypothetical protein
MAGSDLTIKDGNFMRNGKIVPIKIGDAEQIAVLKKYEKAREGEGYIEYSIDGDGYIDVKIEFECTVCKNVIQKTKTINISIFSGFVCDDIDESFNGEFFHCTKCGAKYTMGNDGILLV